jgi:exonuclease III
VSGLNSSSRQSAVRELVSSFRAEVVCIQETKMEEISRFSVISWLGADFADFVFLMLEPVGVFWWHGKAI